MIKIQNKVDCCGCNACGDVCAKGAITFKTDIEGFWYPEVDATKCTDCGLCEKVCPIININELKKNDYVEPKCYAAIHKNLEVRFDSTSGGMFSALADYAYKNGWYVGGAVYDENFGVKFFISNNKEDLPSLRSSKYLQSNSEGMYKEVKRLLKDGEKVLICGLPCQIAALKSYLGKLHDTENLLTVDLICRYINSPLAYRKYLDSLEKQYGGKVVYIKAKNKELGWRKLTHKVVFSNHKTYYGTIDNDIFMKSSMKLNCVSRPSCYSCVFKDFPRIGDITIGDYWINQSKSNLDDNTGTSVVMINSERGKLYFDNILKKIKSEEISFESVTAGNPALYKPLPKPTVNPEEFFARLQTEDFTDVVNSMTSALPQSSSQKFREFAKKAKVALGTLYRAFYYSQFKIVPLCQFVKYNFFHKGVKSNFLKGFVIYPTPHCIFMIHKTATIELNGPLTFGASKFPKSKVETRIRMDEYSKLLIGGDYGFGYGSDVEIFKGATLKIKGNYPTNSFTTIICQDSITIGQNVATGRNVTIRDNNGGHQISMNGYRDKMPIVIGEHVWLCQGCTIMSGVKIGDGSIVGANSLVTSSFPNHVVVGGNPAKITQRDVYWKM